VTGFPTDCTGGTTRKRLLSCLIAASVVFGATAGAAQRATAPGQPDPADRGGVFTIEGCLTRPAPQPAGGPVYVMTQVTSGTGEARVVSAMGAGVPTAPEGSRTSRPTDPPDVVDSSYRVVSDDAKIQFAKHVNHKVRMRGALMGSGAAATARPAGSTQGTPTQTFMAEELEMLADTCS
jgi:hypothetical protein